jgi:CelD/BcsL family acetyltransferase involved in cellulose biosynthesis
MLNGINYHLFRSTEDLHAAIPNWSALWREDPQANPLQTPEWLVPWWHQFGQGDLRAVAIERDGTWIGFLPFFLFRDPYTGERQLLQLGVSTTDYLDGLFAPVCTAGQIRSAVALLLREPGWDVFCASQLPTHSRLFHALRQMTEGRMRLFETDSCSRMRAVSMAELPQKMRRNAMYYRNRALRTGRLELQMANAENWAEAFGALRRLHTERWLERGEPGVLADERVLAWHYEALPLLERAGLLRLSSLRLNGEIIGVLYSLVDPPWRPARTQYFYLTAFSPRFADLRPGTLLLASAIEHATSEGVEIIDMLRGNESYKQMWHLEWTPTRGVSFDNTAEQEIDIGGSQMAA